MGTLYLYLADSQGSVECIYVWTYVLIMDLLLEYTVIPICMTLNDHYEWWYVVITGNGHGEKESEARQGGLLPQFEIVIESEDCAPGGELSHDLKTDEEKLQEFERMIQEGKAGTLQGLLSLLVLEVCHSVVFSMKIYIYIYIYICELLLFLYYYAHSTLVLH